MPFLLVDKPAGITSHDVIDRLRRVTGIRTIGHAGTLDPFATGLLIVAVERDATKHIAEFVGMDKEYVADIVIGQTTDTLDPEGDVTNGPPVTTTNDELRTAMGTLTGAIEQIPPMYSAIKIGGKKLYDLAREGKDVERPPRAVTIHEFSLISHDLSSSLIIPSPFTIQTKIVCSSGTYIRALARDLGLALGTVGYVTALRRTKIGSYSDDNAVKLVDLTAQNWIDAARSDMVPSNT